MRLSSIFVFVSGLTAVSGFVARPGQPVFTSTTSLQAKEEGEVKMANALAVGTLVEFQEKSRVHVGTITEAQHKSSGGARYKIEVHDTGKSFNIADKAVTFSTPAPNTPAKAEKLLTALASIQVDSENQLCQKLEVSPELLEMAWEEAAAEEADTHELTAKSFIELVLNHAASATEEYMAWRLLRGDISHVFFKDIKHHGRILSFKAKARKAVENAKDTFCASHLDEDVDFCFV